MDHWVFPTAVCANLKNLPEILKNLPKTYQFKKKPTKNLPKSDKKPTFLKKNWLKSYFCLSSVLNKLSDIKIKIQ